MERYEILKEIGSGTYGVVWGALDEHTEEVVAIKKLNRKFKAKECTNMREIKALKKLYHPNIAKLKETIKEYDTVYLVFEYMQYNLRQRMRCRKKPFSEDEIKKLCFQIFQGLAYMHGNGYFHRDLKPENLLVNYDDVIKIADLGLVRERNGKPPFTDNVGSRWYCSPEVLLHARRYDSAVDMWAMAAIMVELFTREPLFPGVSTADQLYKICSVIGSPTESTWHMGLHIADDINYQFPQCPGIDLSSLLPTASVEALNLIETLLSWNPCERPTAKEALEHPFFYTCYHVPPPLRLPLVFKMARKREIEMEMKRASLMTRTPSFKSCASDLERLDSMEDLTHLFPENPFLCWESDTVFNMIMEMKQTSTESCITDSEKLEETEDLARLLPENPFY